MLQEKIKEYFKQRKVINRGVNRFLLLNPDIKEQMDKIIEQDYRFNSYYEIINFYVKNIILTKCETCGKDLTYKQTILKHQFCSCKCQANNKELRQIKNKTNLQKYGTIYISQNNDIKQKVKQTCLQRYGVEYASQSKEIRQKVKKTNLQKFGCQWALSSKEIHQKAKQTRMQKYGVEYTSQIQFAKIKKLQTRKRHLEEGEIYQQTIHSWQHINNLETKQPLFQLKEYKGWYHQYKWRCKKCGCEFYSKYERGQLTRSCPQCESIQGRSIPERQLVQFCKNYYPNLKQNIKDIIKPYELDIVIPQLNLAIQFNGDYWHSVDKRGMNYHLNKTQLCNEKGYRLIHIWQNEWFDNRQQICKKLEDIFLKKQNLVFEQKEIILDRSWYNNINIQNYEMKEIKQPILVERNNFNVQNCGYLIYNRIIL